MKLKTYTAATMIEAMEKVRADLGVDAIIVSTHDSERGRGVQVTAALDEADDALRDSLGAERDGLDAISETIEDALSYHGVPERAILRLLKAVRQFEGDDALEALAAAIDEYIDFAPLPRPGEGIHMFIGPPGAGKTSIAAKVAAQAALAGDAVSLISIDTVKAGAVEQLAAYARIMEQNLVTAARPEDLAAILAVSQGKTSVLIDTPGSNPYNADEVADLRRFMCDKAIEPVLVLPAGLDAADAGDTARIFAELGCKRLIVTRLDAARRLGGLISASEAGALALAGVSIAPSIAHGLRPINPVTLARLLLHDPAEAYRDLPAAEAPSSNEDQI